MQVFFSDLLFIVICWEAPQH